MRLTTGDVIDFNKLSADRSSASNKNRKRSRKLYNLAITRSNRSRSRRPGPGSLVKLMMESVRLYPNSKAYYSFIEYRLKQLRYKKNKIKDIVLRRAIQHSHIVIKLNNIDSMLSKAERKVADNNIVCIKNYIDAKKINQNCKALEWINIR